MTQAVGEKLNAIVEMINEAENESSDNDESITERRPITKKPLKPDSNHKRKRVDRGK